MLNAMLYKLRCLVLVLRYGHDYRCIKKNKQSYKKFSEYAIGVCFCGAPLKIKKNGAKHEMHI